MSRDSGSGVSKTPSWFDKLSKRRFGREVIASSLGLVLSLLATLASVYDFARPAKKLAVEERLAELDRVRTALSELDKYVQSQQQSITSTTATLNELEKKKNELDKVISINRESAEALLRFQEQRSTRAAWFAYAMSYVLGVFSSLTATFVLAARRKPAENAQPPAGAA